MSLIFLLLLLLIGGFGLSMGTSEPAITPQLETRIPRWAVMQGQSGNAGYLAGARLFVESGCTNCHTYLGTGSTNLGAPDLSAEGTKGHSVSNLMARMKCPACVTRGSSMPSFGALGQANLRKIALFLAASKRGA